MKFKIFFACLVILTIFAYLQAGWILQHLGTHTLYSIDFPPYNINTGFACGEGGVILKTTDSGVNWCPKETPVFLGFTGVSFPVNATTGYICTDSFYVLKTIDGGDIWSLIPVGQNVSFRAIHFPENNNVGYAVGLRGAIWATYDGFTWGDISIPEAFGLYGLHFIDNNHGWVVGDNGYIAYTYNAGLNWNQVISNVSVRLLGVYFRDLNNGWVVGDSNTFLKTTNSGTDWDTVQIPLPDSTTLYSVIFPVDVNTGIVCGSEGKIARTLDGCVSWSITTITAGYHLYCVEFPEVNYPGWICGSQEAILKAVDAGIEEENFRLAESKNITCSPNPFRKMTNIQFFNPNNSPVTLKIYDCLGKLLRTLALGKDDCASWDGKNEQNKRVKSGIYIGELTTPNGIFHRFKLVVLD
jgi:photosystem II stability/assembly factor-like uncharacterized protein